MFRKLPVLSVTLALRQECYITYTTGPVDLNFKLVLMTFKRKEDESFGYAIQNLNNYFKKLLSESDVGQNSGAISPSSPMQH